MKEQQYRIAGEIHCLDNMITRVLAAKIKNAGFDEGTLMHGRILRYLYDHREEDIFQRDIEKQFSIGRSAVTNILQLMEKKGLVKREPVEHDARLKRVALTDKGIRNKEVVEQTLLTIDHELLTDITEEELDKFLEVFQKIRKNVAQQDEVRGGFIEK